MHLLSIFLCAFAFLPQPAQAADAATVNVGGIPFHIVMSPNGEYAYVAVQDKGMVSVIDTATNKVTAKISVSSPYDIAITPDGNTSTLQTMLVQIGCRRALQFQ